MRGNNEGVDEFVGLPGAAVPVLSRAISKYSSQHSQTGSPKSEFYVGITPKPVGCLPSGTSEKAKRTLGEDEVAFASSPEGNGIGASEEATLRSIGDRNNGFNEKDDNPRVIRITGERPPLSQQGFFSPRPHRGKEGRASIVMQINPISQKHDQKLEAGCCCSCRCS